ncbi:MAG: sigma-E factor negative regulatory protein [Marinagarivorans sp.]
MTSSDEMLKESLSALMDNQASDLELRRILKQLPEDETLGATWRRYQLASTLLQRKETAFLNIDLSAAIADAVASEPALNQSSNTAASSVNARAPAWLRWGSKSALAASVAVAVLIGAQQFSHPSLAPLAVAPALPANTVAGKPVEPGELTSTNSIAANLPEATLPEAAQVQSAPDGFALPLPMARTVSSQAERVQPMQVQPVSLNQTDWRNDPEVQAQLNQMLLDHASRSAAHGSFGLLPFTRTADVPADVSLNTRVEPVAGKH